MKKLNVLFLWHMHQPLYQVDNEPLRMPWVRLHATKDYVGMPSLAKNSPRLRMTFNVTPVLWDQLELYKNGGTDKELAVSLKSPESLSMEDRRFMLTKMFTGNRISIINPFSRYAELYDRYGHGGEEAAYRISTQELIDLAAWRMLAWINPVIRKSDFKIAALEKKGGYFTSDDVHVLAEKSLEIIKSVYEIYRDLCRSNQIDMITSPYYHPILPLIIDSDTAIKSAGMNGVFPTPFSYIEDAKWHVKAGIQKHRALFGKIPSGMWPAEGSVSQQTAALFAENGVRWIATDEGIIQKSLKESVVRNDEGCVQNPELIYQPFLLETENGPITIFFRDHYLSDLLGFDYQSLPRETAIQDFIARLNHIKETTSAMNVEPCVSIILDGENAWEHYPDGGFPFLESLFQAIEKEPGLQLDTFTDYLNRHMNNSFCTISNLSSGSWISGDFGIWIGQKEENTAWDYLRDLDNALTDKGLSSFARNKARTFLRKAQGSDSFWWYGDIHYTQEKGEFDTIFRSWLIKGYESAELIPPLKLGIPISSVIEENPLISQPKNLISPVIDGEIGSYFEWFGSGSVPIEQRYSSMHRGFDLDSGFKELKFGFDLENLYLQLIPNKNYFVQPQKGISLSFTFKSSLNRTFGFGLDFSWIDGHFVFNPISSDFSSSQAVEGIRAAFSRVIEISIPFSVFGPDYDQKLIFMVEIRGNGKVSGRVPETGEIEIFRPSPDYDSIFWRI
ncbi:MAG: glycoside hydrolase family 57 protein [bacterium]